MTAKTKYIEKTENPFRAARVRLGLTQEDLAKHGAVSLEAVLAAENNPTSLPLHELSPLANHLNLDPGEVFEYLHEQIAEGVQKGKV